MPEPEFKPCPLCGTNVIWALTPSGYCFHSYNQGRPNGGHIITWIDEVGELVSVGYRNYEGGQYGWLDQPELAQEKLVYPPHNCPAAVLRFFFGHNDKRAGNMVIVDEAVREAVLPKLGDYFDNPEPF